MILPLWEEDTDSGWPDSLADDSGWLSGPEAPAPCLRARHLLLSLTQFPFQVMELDLTIPELVSFQLCSPNNFFCHLATQRLMQGHLIQHFPPVPNPFPWQLDS